MCDCSTTVIFLGDAYIIAGDLRPAFLFRRPVYEEGILFVQGACVLDQTPALDGSIPLALPIHLSRTAYFRRKQDEKLQRYALEAIFIPAMHGV